MSFILEGLKKLEEKRHRDSVPDLLTVHVSEPHKSSKKNLWPYLLIAALIINALTISFWLLPRQSEVQVAEETESVSKSDEDIKPAATPLPEAAVDIPDRTDTPIEAEKSLPGLKAAPSELEQNTAPAEPEQLDIPNETPVRDASFSFPANEKPEPSASISFPSEEPDRVLELSELPPPVRQELPEINISAHIYSNNPSSRIVNINGSIIREGGKIIPGLNVDEITLTGVILKYHEYRFRMRGL